MTAIDDATLRGLLDRATKLPDVPTPQQKAEQGAKCGCGGSDEMCYCQNVVVATNPAIARLELDRISPDLAREVLALRADNLRLTRELATARDDALMEAAGICQQQAENFERAVRLPEMRACELAAYYVLALIRAPSNTQSDAPMGAKEMK